MSAPIRRSHIYNALDIAKHVVQYSHDNQYGISNLKLQKILYFIQAQFLITYDEPCFYDDIIAWDSGPIVEAVYQEYKFFGSGTIPSIYHSIVPDIIHPRDATLIDEVIDMCKNYSATDLLRLIHNQTPWKNGRLRASNRITNEDLIAFFAE